MYIYAYPTGQLVGSEEELDLELCHDLEFVEQRDCDEDFIGSHRLVDGLIQPTNPGHITLRSVRYPSVGEQLGQLWHDIDQGLFGELAKTGSFYQSILQVKQEIPKTDK